MSWTAELIICLKYSKPTFLKKIFMRSVATDVPRNTEPSASKRKEKIILTSIGMTRIEYCGYINTNKLVRGMYNL